MNYPESRSVMLLSIPVLVKGKADFVTAGAVRTFYNFTTSLPKCPAANIDW
jgi:hypothetical protein